MPNVTTYIRNADMELWKAVPNKAELIHNALNDKTLGMDGVFIDTTKNKIKIEDDGKLISTPIPKDDAFVPRPPDPETGYTCCTKARPCKHWQWDGNKSAYINSITGKEREAEL